MHFLANNIRFKRKQLGWTQADLSGRLGVNRSVVGAYEEGRAEPRLSTLLQLAELFGLSLDALLMQDVSEAGVAAHSSPPDVQGKQLRILPVVVDREMDEERIAIVPVRAAAGYLSGYRDSTYIGQLPSFRLPVVELSAKRSYRIFQIKGDSMLPVPDGAYVIAEYVQDWHSLRDYQPCVVLSTEAGVVYKRVVPHWAAGHIQLRSDNPEYAPYELPTGELLEVWKALGYLSFSLPEPGDAVPLVQLQALVGELRTEIDRLKT